MAVMKVDRLKVVLVWNLDNEVKTLVSLFSPSVSLSHSLPGKTRGCESDL